MFSHLRHTRWKRKPLCGTICRNPINAVYRNNNFFGVLQLVRLHILFGRPGRDAQTRVPRKG